MKEHCRSFSPIVVGIIEPKKGLHKVSNNYWHSLNLSPRHQNCRAPRWPNIWFLAQPTVVTNIIFSSEQAIVSDCLWQNINFRVAVVHGANDSILRRDLWYDLLHFVDGQTFFIGDFNAVKGAHERFSSVMPSRASCSEFCRFIDDTGFLEPQSTGLQFSWSGRRFLPTHVESLLDRALISPTFADLWSSVITQVLPRTSSDHSPIVLRCNSLTTPGRKLFRFLNMWTAHPDFLEVVGTSWKESVNTPCPILMVMLKLKRLKGVLRAWNKTGFGHVDMKLADLQNDLLRIQGCISREGYTDSYFDEEISKQAEISTMLSRKNVHMQQQSRIAWLNDGDRNTAFFHRMLKYCHSGLMISHLDIDGVAEYDQSAIESHIVDHFTTLFSQGEADEIDLAHLEANIDLQVSLEQNKELIEIPSDLEISNSVLNMDAHSAPGPDSFAGMFYHTCWNIIKEDIIRAVRCFFLNSYMPNGCNVNTLILIPKSDSVSTVSDLRPIILSNFFFKIISKILAVLLNKVASVTVSPN
ncbi:uncharacterized protein LOC130999897 [Salvia miltiorrhiza]|uniref:uncharacterized protein LOC130999897 n=1 Tax=Salvia miltiorrhiza TaxID=226208 RepID=UPI0025AB60D7|nr:uncharacterized protein LOC130999897 [Salvia miltiorrhiza]